MPKYRVYLQTAASTWLEVDAEDKAEAVDRAITENQAEICGQCSGWGAGTQALELGDEWDLPGIFSSESYDQQLDNYVEEVTE